MLIDLTLIFAKIKSFLKPEGGIHLFLAHLRISSNCWNSPFPHTDPGSHSHKDDPLGGEHRVCAMLTEPIGQ